jgi:hypothetical protein
VALTPLKGLPKLPKLYGLRRRKRRFHPLPLTPPKLDLVSSEISELARRLKDETLARRVLRLRERFVQATIPELVVYDWLSRQGHRFWYQVEFNGGRRQLGGLVPDFVVAVGGQAMVWQVQGEYWHTLQAQKERARQVRLSLMGQIVMGNRRARKVIDLWESDIYRKRPQIFQMALAGLGLRE